MKDLKKYQIIYCDPPWSYSNGTVPSGGVNKHYSTMKIEDICAIKVPSADNAILFLWATTALLPEALEVIKAWGFTYKSSMVWDKIRRGVGYWFIGQHEFLLVGVKGKVSPPPRKVKEFCRFINQNEKVIAKNQMVLENLLKNGIQTIHALKCSPGLMGKQTFTEKRYLINGTSGATK